MNVREGVGVLDEYIYNICRKLHTTMYSDSHDIYIYIFMYCQYIPSLYTSPTILKDIFIDTQASIHTHIHNFYIPYFYLCTNLAASRNTAASHYTPCMRVSYTPMAACPMCMYNTCIHILVYVTSI